MFQPSINSTCPFLTAIALNHAIGLYRISSNSYEPSGVPLSLYCLAAILRVQNIQNRYPDCHFSFADKLEFYFPLRHAALNLLDPVKWPWTHAKDTNGPHFSHGFGNLVGMVPKLWALHHLSAPRTISSPREFSVAQGGHFTTTAVSTWMHSFQHQFH